MSATAKIIKSTNVKFLLVVSTLRRNDKVNKRHKNVPKVIANNELNALKTRRIMEMKLTEAIQMQSSSKIFAFGLWELVNDFSIGKLFGEYIQPCHRILQ